MCLVFVVCVCVCCRVSSSRCLRLPVSLCRRRLVCPLETEDDQENQLQDLTLTNLGRVQKHTSLALVVAWTLVVALLCRRSGGG